MRKNKKDGCNLDGFLIGTKQTRDEKVTNNSRYFWLHVTFRFRKITAYKYQL